MIDEPKIKSAELFSQLMPNGVRRTLWAYGAYDFRQHPRNYGIHGMAQTFTCCKANCMVQLEFNTQLYTKEVRKEFRSSKSEPYAQYCVHSPIALYVGQEPNHHACEWTGGPCYGDWSGLVGCDIMEEFLQDPESLWRDLEARLDQVLAYVVEQASMARNYS